MTDAGLSIKSVAVIKEKIKQEHHEKVKDLTKQLAHDIEFNIEKELKRDITATKFRIRLTQPLHIETNILHKETAALLLSLLEKTYLVYIPGSSTDIFEIDLEAK